MPRAKKTTAVIEEVTELPSELKEQLNALIPTGEVESNVTFSGHQANLNNSLIKAEEQLNTLVPTVEPEVNETFLKLQDNLSNALVKAEEELKRIDERAEYAISVVSQAIRTRAAVEKGRVLLDIKKKYQNVPEFEGRFTDWYRLAGYSHSAVSRLINAAQLVDDASPIFGEELLLQIAPTTLTRINQLPVEAKLDVLEKVEKGDKVTIKEVQELANQPEVKLSKSQELLAEARAKREEARATVEDVKADPDVRFTDAEYINAMNSAAYAEKRVKELELEVDEFRLLAKQEKAKAETEASARQKLESELDQLKFDPETVRGQRIKRIQSTLTVQLPQVLSDIQKYRAEKPHYDEEYQIALDTLIKDLKSYLMEFE